MGLDSEQVSEALSKTVSEDQAGSEGISEGVGEEVGPGGVIKKSKSKDLTATGRSASPSDEAKTEISQVGVAAPLTSESPVIDPVGLDSHYQLDIGVALQAHSEMSKKKKEIDKKNLKAAQADVENKFISGTDKAESDRIQGAKAKKEEEDEAAKGVSAETVKATSQTPGVGEVIDTTGMGKTKDGATVGTADATGKDVSTPIVDQDGIEQKKPARPDFSKKRLEEMKEEAKLEKAKTADAKLKSSKDTAKDSDSSKLGRSRTADEESEIHSEKVKLIEELESAAEEKMKELSKELESNKFLSRRF